MLHFYLGHPVLHSNLKDFVESFHEIFTKQRKGQAFIFIHHPHIHPPLGCSENLMCDLFLMNNNNALISSIVLGNVIFTKKIFKKMKFFGPLKMKPCRIIFY